jgi:hypothetical protein
MEAQTANTTHLLLGDFLASICRSKDPPLELP